MLLLMHIIKIDQAILNVHNITKKELWVFINHLKRKLCGMMTKPLKHKDHHTLKQIYRHNIRR